MAFVIYSKVDRKFLRADGELGSRTDELRAFNSADEARAYIKENELPSHMIAIPQKPIEADGTKKKLDWRGHFGKTLDSKRQKFQDMIKSRKSPNK